MKMIKLSRRTLFGLIAACAVSMSAFATQYVSASMGSRGSDSSACMNASGAAVSALHRNYPEARLLSVSCRVENGYPIPITVATAYGVID
ncbi:hypothetical protein GCM10009092_08010 [Bowmanella denitrificans]|uniref:Uncharacterized protein n=1 Tax=Bowmanella denitrificans TaxID=366582 RepID=A0ABP3GKR3_9ALTE